MKNALYIILLFTGVVNGQIVNIPDVNFKDKLLASSPTYAIAKDAMGNGIVVDTNGDGQIQVSEALLVYKLMVTFGNIFQLTGIESFENLVDLNCSNTSISSLNVSSLSYLKILKCDNSQLNSINIAGLINLEKIYTSGNQLTSLNLTNLPNLQHLDFSNNMVTSINLSGLSSLMYLNCGTNLLTSLTTQGLTNLSQLMCDNNSISNLSVNTLPNLHYLYFRYNQLSFLEITNCPVIFLADFRNNLLSDIDFLGSTDIENLQIDNNNFTDVNCADLLPNLETLTCNNNPIVSINAVNLVNLEWLECSNTLITTLDISSNAFFTALNCTNNPNLTTVFLKFGRENSLTIQGGYPLNNNPNLQYVCVDEYRIDTFSNYFIQNNMPNVVVNSYCSFTPGGNYNTVAGNMIFDANNNGCDVSDAVQPNIKININDGTSQGATFTNNTGNYNFYTQAGSFTVNPNVENPTFFNFSPTSATIPFANTNNNTSTQNFCISANGVHNDVEVVIAPTTPARPGFDAVYKIVYKNKGNQTVSGSVALSYDDTVLDFVSATNSPSSQNTGLLNWNYINLLPFENRSFYVTLNVNSPVETPAVNINDVLNYTVAITPVVGDENPLDNQFVFHQTVVGSFDPNDITCLEGDIVPPSEIGNYLHYVVNFENTGTAQAENIVVRTDINPAKFDVNTLQMLNTSHNAYIRQTGNTIEFIFKEIYLDTGGHGNVLLKIRSKENLVTGDMVSNRAGIYFDYNAPIDTGMANTVFQALSNSIFETDDSILVYPNPTTSVINIQSDFNMKSIQLYDVQGRLLQTSIENNTNAVIDISQKTTGIYFLKITSDKGTKIEKIIKE